MENGSTLTEILSGEGLVGDQIPLPRVPFSFQSFHVHIYLWGFGCRTTPALPSELTFSISSKEISQKIRFFALA
jgi:hypothetical protein